MFAIVFILKNKIVLDRNKGSKELHNNGENIRFLR
jgi:hypothetical protein